MKGLTFASLILALGAMVIALTRPSGSSVRSAPLVAAPGGAVADGDLARLARAVANLGAQLDALEARTLALESRPAAGGTRAPVATQESTEELEALQRLAAALDNPELAPTSGFESLVLDVIETREERERAERDERRLQAMLDRVNERVNELALELGLNDDQSNDLRRVLTDQQLKRDELFAKRREEGTWDREAMREEMRVLRDQANAELQTFLAPDQYDRYVELERDDRFGGRDRDGGGRGGDGRGRGGRGS